MFNKDLWQRCAYKIPNLFFAPHSLIEYEQIISAAKEQGYKFYTLQDFRSAEISDTEAFIILRHDIDTDPQGALRFAEIELKHGVKASYFFRQATWHPGVMNVLHHGGHEVGYHYEELSDYAKKHHIKRKEEILKHLAYIRKTFAENLSALSKTVDFQLSSAAAHGDFSYKTLDVGNKLLLKDEQLRASTGIVYEAYDEPLVDKYRNHISDKPAPQRFYPASPQELIQGRDSFLFLSHPRWWMPNPLVSAISDCRAMVQKILW
ncbi:hypothetical protein MASR2M64_08990 [Candidatus Cloacimonadota bacterium]